MKEINEEMQLKIFDLLEGNLNDKEKAELLNEISASPLLKKEYDLMARTYLSKDEVLVFSNKQSLYRKPGFIVSIHPLARYAAAVVGIALCSTAIWYFMKNQAPETGSVLANKNNLKTEIRKANPSNPTVDESVVNGIHSLKKYTEVTTAFSKIGDTILKESIITPEPVIEKREVQVAIVEPVAETTPLLIDSSVGSYMQNTPVPVSKKRSLSYKLIQGTRAMLANLQLPDVKLITEKKADKSFPTVKMAISTYKTDVIATLIE